MKKRSQAAKSDEIDLVEIIKITQEKKTVIIKTLVVSVFLSGIIAFTSKEEYESYCTLLPEIQEEPNLLNSLGGLAELVSIDLSKTSNNGDNSLSPELYPSIIKSVPFLDSLINSPIYFEAHDSVISSYNYFHEIDKPSLVGLLLEYTIGLPGKIRSKLSTDVHLNNYGMIRYSKEEWKVLEEFAERVDVELDIETGLVSISAEMPDPVAAALITQKVLNHLTNVVTKHKLKKIEEKLVFIEDRFEEAKHEYELRQGELANFTDRNRNINTSSFQIEYERLQNNVDVAFEVYKGLASQLEQIKIQIKENTPVFTILEPVRIPEEKSRPKKPLILLLGLLVGFFAWGVIIFYTFYFP